MVVLKEGYRLIVAGFHSAQNMLQIHHVYTCLQISTYYLRTYIIMYVCEYVHMYICMYVCTYEQSWPNNYGILVFPQG